MPVTVLCISHYTSHQIRCGAREGPIFAAAAGVVVSRRQRGGTQGRITHSLGRTPVHLDYGSPAEHSSIDHHLDHHLGQGTPLDLGSAPSVPATRSQPRPTASLGSVGAAFATQADVHDRSADRAPGAATGRVGDTPHLATYRAGHARTALGTEPGRHLVALDIDGTTLHHDGTLSSDVYDAVRATVAAGHDVVIATGRSLLEAWPVIDALGLRTGYAVCSNGAVTLRLDPTQREGYRIVDEITFDPKPALELLRDVWPGAVFAVERVGVGFDISAPFPEGDLSGELAVSSWETLTSSPTTRLTFYSPDAHVEEFAHTVERIGLHGVNYAVGFTAWLDVAPAGVSKASALQGVRDRLGIAPTRTIGVGDQRNDLEMLQWAACGVAMGNAPAEVKAVADLVTGHVADDGLADVLRALVPAR